MTCIFSALLFFHYWKVSCTKKVGCVLFENRRDFGSHRVNKWFLNESALSVFKVKGRKRNVKTNATSLQWARQISTVDKWKDIIYFLHLMLSIGSATYITHHEPLKTLPWGGLNGIGKERGIRMKGVGSILLCALFTAWILWSQVEVESGGGGQKYSKACEKVNPARERAGEIEENLWIGTEGDA